MKIFTAVLIVIAMSFTVLGTSLSSTKTQTTLSKIIQKQAKEIKALKIEIARLKQSQGNVSKNISPKRKLSTAELRKASSLKSKIKDLDREIKRQQEKINSIKYMIVKMTKSDRKGWFYRKGGSIRRLNSMSTLPQKWNRRKIRIAYISKDQKKQKLKTEYSKVLTKLEKEKQALEKELSKLT